MLYVKSTLAPDNELASVGLKALNRLTYDQSTSLYPQRKCT